MSYAKNTRYTKSTFEMVAGIVRGTRAWVKGAAPMTPDEQAIFDRLVENFTMVFVASNPRFDAARFRDACLGE